MTKETQKLSWNGQELEISFEPNNVLSRIAGEAFANLKVTNSANSFRLLINEALPVSLIESAGGAAAYVDVMLSIEFQRAA